MTPEAIGFLIHQSSIARSLTLGASLQGLALKFGSLSDTIVCNHTLNMYAKCGHLGASRKVFDEMCEKNLVSWSAMISGYAQDGQHALAVEMFSKCPFAPNEYIFARTVSSCSGLEDLGAGFQVHARALKSGCDSTLYVGNALISMYIDGGRHRDALLMYEKMLDPNVVTYNALITGYGRNRQVIEAFSVYKLMCKRQILPDRITFAGVISNFSELIDWHAGTSVHCHSIKYKLDSCAFVGNALMIMYSNFNLVQDMERAFKGIDDHDIITWNTLISSYTRCSSHERALITFGKMLEETRIKPDELTFATILAACAGFASLPHGKEIHAHLIRAWLDQDIGSCNSLINMYAKCGSIENAYLVFRRITHCNLLSWNTIIGGFANHGFAWRAIELFEEMKLKRISPDSFSFLGLLTGCNHAGLVDEGLLIFNTMQETYGISPEVEHFSCVIDLLGRSGRLHEAEDYMKRYPFASSPVVLGCFLSACRLQRNQDIGEQMGNQLLQLQPGTSSTYVLLSNLYSSVDMWDSVSATRKLLKRSGVKKEAGHSLIELKGCVHKFLTGEPGSANAVEIKNILNTFSLETGKDSLRFFGDQVAEVLGCSYR